LEKAMTLCLMKSPCPRNLAHVGGLNEGKPQWAKMGSPAKLAYKPQMGFEHSALPKQTTARHDITYRLLIARDFKDFGSHTARKGQLCPPTRLEHT